MGSSEQDAVGTAAAIKQEPEHGEISDRHTSPALSDTRQESCFTSGYLPSPTQTSAASSKTGIKRDYDTMNGETDLEGPAQQDRKHDQLTEALPMTALTHRSFISAEKIAQDTPNDILRIIEQSGFIDEDFEFLKGQADRVKKIYKSREIKIGLKGDSGTGKSSLINSLLGYEGIAPFGNEGEACTAVVQEFRKPRPSQQTPFEAEVTFLSPPAREAALKDWVGDFWDSRQVGADEEDGDDLDGDDFDDEVKSGEGSATAVEAIHSLFSDHDECKGLEETKAFLSTAKSREDSRLVAKLKAWMESLLKKLGVEMGTYTISAATPDLLQDEVAPFLAQVNDGRPSPWPLVKIVRTYFDCPLLSHDIVLADLPGTSDINKTRVEATNVYMREVEHTGVVSKIDRAASDSVTNKSLIEAYKRKRGPNVFMVATHSDSINTNSPGVIDKCINMSGASPSDVQELSTLKDELDTIRLDLKSLESKENQAKNSRDFSLMGELSSRCDDLRAQKVTKLHQSAAICIKIRNNKVRKTLIERHYTMMKQEILPVFCVSNSEYMVHIVGYDEEHPPKMNVEATEIPKLRAYIYSLPAKRKVSAFKHHVKYALPSLINSLAMTCSQSKLKRRDELQKILLNAQKPIRDDITQIFKDFLATDVLAKLAKIKKKKATYIAAATAKLRTYSKWKSSTQKSFCQHRGNWETQKVGYHDWNSEMLEPMINDLKDDLHPWEDVSEPLACKLSDKVIGTLQSLIEQMGESAGPSRNVLKPFFDDLELQVEPFDDLCKTVAHEMERELCLIRDHTLLAAEAKDCFFIQILDKTYVECAAMTGPGVSRKRMDVLENKIREKGPANPFHKVHEKAKNAALKVVDHSIERLVVDVVGRFDNFHRTFMRAFKTDESDAPEAKALRHELRSRLPNFQYMIAECGRLIQESCESETKSNI
ncbi:hypothetical protein BFW01_g6081 [Lasiodiplodia theobromae]|nr:hypothetical protein BFW01_g6081 [Lasiodiplodia theobromae]